MNKVDEIIERYANQILRDNESRIRIQSKDVKALADLIDARANYRMAFRIFESGSTSQI